MHPVSRHIPLSPFHTADLSSGVVVVDGEVFTVKRLQSASFIDTERAEAKKKMGARTLGAHLKTLSPARREDFRHGKKIVLMPLGAAERKAAALLREKLAAEFRKTTGIKYINRWVRDQHKRELEPTDEQIGAEIQRLVTVYHSVMDTIEGD